MSYFPQSLVPSRVKSEAADVDGNRYIMGGDDHNRIDAEIRAIEKALLGVQTSGGGDPSLAGQCSTLEVMLAVAQQLQQIRDTMVDSTSGIVAVKDDSVVGVDGIIPFPAAWHTTLVSNIPDDTVNDEDELPILDSVELDDVSGMPDEGYVTVINDVSFGKSLVMHGETLAIYSRSTATGKVNKDFFYQILTTRTGTTFVVTGLPAGLVFAEDTISGIPTVVGESTAKITATNGQQTVSMDLLVEIHAADTPAILDADGNPTAALTYGMAVGTVLSYEVKVDGAVVSMSASPLPQGITTYGLFISGTPRLPGVYSINVVVTDGPGDSASAVLTLTVEA